jgi:competence ComEA-like helix-hairpin-helix protein
MFGFTRNEQRVLLFLSVCFLAGGAIKIYQDHYQPLPVTPVDPILREDGNPELYRGFTSREDQTQTGSFFTVPLNTATQIDLERIPGIGPVMAKRILSYREAKGRFETLEELLNVKGIGPKKLLKIRPYIKMQ